MRYIVSKQIINDNIKIAKGIVGSRTLSLMFKEYYEMLYQMLEDDPSGEIFSIGIDGSVCYALGMASMHNKGAVVNNLIDIAALHSFGMNLFYIPIDTMDGREGMSIYEASQLAKNIHKFVGSSVKIMGMVTNGCINDRHINSSEEWRSLWSAFDNNLDGISVGGSFWLNKIELLPDFVTDIRIGRFMLFGIIPYSDEHIGKNCMVIEGNVLGVNLNSGKVMVDLGDAYCDPNQCEPYNQDLKLSDTSSNYAMYSTPNAGNYYLGQRLLFTPNYGHSSALSRLNIHFDYE